MSLLNNKNKTNIRHTIVDICENINVKILGDAQDTPTELIRRVAGLVPAYYGRNGPQILLLPSAYANGFMDNRRAGRKLFFI